MSDVARVSLSSAGQLSTARKPNYCCESRVCGRVYSFSDYLFFTGEGLGIGGSVAAYAANTYLWASGGIALSAVVLYGHCLWRRSRKLLEINEVNTDLQMTNMQMERTEKKTEEMARILQVEEKDLSETVIQITKAAEETSSADLQLQASARSFEHENEGLERTKSEIQSVNQKLENQVKILQEALKKINTYLATFNQHNNHFKQTATEVDASFHSLASTREKIAADISELEGHLDRDIATLASLIKETLFREIVPLVTHQQRELKKEIEGLTMSVDEYRQIVADINVKTEQLKKLVAQEEITKENVAQLKQQAQSLGEEMTKLLKAREMLSQVEDHFHKDAASLASTERGFARTEERIEALQKRLETTLIELNSKDVNRV